MFVFSPLEQFDVIRICNISWSGYDISFVNILLPLVFFVIFIHLLLGFFLRDFKLIPDYWQISLELLFKLILDIVFQQAGSRALVFFPFIFSLFFFILFCNFMSLLPFGIALTSHIIIIFFLSCSLWLSVFFIGVLRHQVEFFRLFVPEAPFFVLFILIPIEIVSYAIRALSLALRLSANILAGHILVFIISNFIMNMSALKFWFLSICVILFLVLVLELGVAFVQAYVFTVLFCIYLNDSLKNPSDH
jgi:F-type H+-transporting ATPase subunit a